MEFYGFSDTIHTRQDIQCVLHGRFVSKGTIKKNVGGGPKNVRGGGREGGPMRGL